MRTTIAVIAVLSGPSRLLPAPNLRPVPKANKALRDHKDKL